MNGSICGGTECSRRNKCKKYNMPPGDYQYIDWSTNGWGDTNGDSGWCCGDLSDGYPLFEEIVFNNNDDKMMVIIYGDEEKDHFTYIKNNDLYYRFWADKYDGIPAKEILKFLEFLGREIFLVYKPYNSEKPQAVN